MPDDIHAGRHKSEASRAPSLVGFAVLSFPVRFPAISTGCHPKPHSQSLCRAQPTAWCVPGWYGESQGLHLLLRPSIVFSLHPTCFINRKDHSEGGLQLFPLHVSLPQPLYSSSEPLFLYLLCSLLFFLFFFLYLSSESSIFCLEPSGLQHQVKNTKEPSEPWKIPPVI